MINAKIDYDARKLEVQLKGSVVDLCSDLGLLIGYVYCMCLEKDPQLADLMRHLMVKLVSDESPVWLPDAEFAEVREEHGKAGST